jgi:hypothetical protein
MVDVLMKYGTCLAILELCHRLTVEVRCPQVHALEVRWSPWV